MSSTFAPSLEWQIDNRLEELSGKILLGQATAEEQEEYDGLVLKRAMLMRTNDRVNINRVRARLRKSG